MLYREDEKGKSTNETYKGKSIKQTTQKERQ